MTTTSTVLAAATAETAGLVLGRLLTIALAVGLIVLGVRMRRRGNRVGGVLVIVLGALFALGLLASLTSGVSTAP